MSSRAYYQPTLKVTSPQANLKHTDGAAPVQGFSKQPEPVKISKSTQPGTSSTYE